ncbi:hypothetical protein HYR54_11785 [Candidatus Acetothermia bacterium]|nr:hypothetical protein [Candidatus Acetothermia bacterium]
MSTETSKRKVQAYFPTKLYRQLRRYSQQHGVSMAEVIRQAVGQHIQYIEDAAPSAQDWENDPINKIVGMFKEVNVTDGSVNHDHYAYGFPLKAKFRRRRKRV